MERGLRARDGHDALGSADKPTRRDGLPVQPRPALVRRAQVQDGVAHRPRRGCRVRRRRVVELQQHAPGAPAHRRDLPLRVPGAAQAGKLLHLRGAREPAGGV